MLNELKDDQHRKHSPIAFGHLVGACLATGDRIFATGSAAVSKCVLRSYACFRAYNHGLNRSPKHVAIISFLRSYLSPMSLLLGRELCGDSTFRPPSKLLSQVTSVVGALLEPEIQARKRHININFLVRLLLGRPRECPWDKPRFSSYFTQWKPSLSLGQTQFVPGTIPGTKGGTISSKAKGPGEKGAHRNHPQIFVSEIGRFRAQISP